MKMYSLTADQITATCNQAIETALGFALKKGTIDNDTFDKLIRQKIVVSDNENIFSKFVSKFIGKKDTLQIYVVTLETEFETE